MNVMKRWLATAVLLLMAQSLVAQEAIEITRGTDKATPIAVVPFGWQGGSPLPEDLAQIASNNLRNTGMFAPFDRSNMLSNPTQPSEIFPRDWTMLGVEYVVAGRVTKDPAGDRFEVTYSLYSVVREEVLMSKTVSGTQGQLRDMAHHLSDEVFEEITGIRGAFNTKLLYVSAERFSAGNTRYTLQRSDYDGARATTFLRPLTRPMVSVLLMCRLNRVARKFLFITCKPVAASGSPVSKGLTGRRPGRQMGRDWLSYCHGTGTRRSM
jgi:TolB protein